jgi:TPP-dependent 2-oxoacid decarboxylase
MLYGLIPFFQYQEIALRADCKTAEQQQYQHIGFDHPAPKYQ